MLGSTWMHNHEILFDLENKKIAFASSDCAGSYIIEPDYSDYTNKRLWSFNLKIVIFGIMLSLLIIVSILYIRNKTKRDRNILYCNLSYLTFRFTNCYFK